MHAQACSDCACYALQLGMPVQILSQTLIWALWSCLESEEYLWTPHALGNSNEQHKCEYSMAPKGCSNIHKALFERPLYIAKVHKPAPELSEHC